MNIKAKLLSVSIALFFIFSPSIQALNPYATPNTQVTQEIAKTKEVNKTVLSNIRAASVSVEIDEKFCGSGTLIEKNGETWCLTAAHVVSSSNNIRITQYKNGKTVTVYAAVHKMDKNKDFAVLKVGKGVFESKISFHKNKQEQDTFVIHCGSFCGLHHSLTRGMLVEVDRQFAKWKCVDQLDITAY